MPRSLFCTLALLLQTGSLVFADLFHLNAFQDWRPVLLVDGEFESVAPNSHDSDMVFLAVQSGGIERVTISGKWSRALLLESGDFLDLSAKVEKNPGQFYAVDRSGSIHLIHYTAKGWKNSLLKQGNYSSVASYVQPGRPASDMSVLATRADGGIDRIHFDPEKKWTASRLLDDGMVYVDIAPAEEGFGAYAVSANGDLHRITYQGKWVSSLVLTGNYLSVCANSEPGSNSVFASRASGGVDLITQAQNGGWLAERVLATGEIFQDIASDLDANGSIYAVTGE